MKFSEIGVSNYYYKLSGCGGRLRKNLEDFYVEERFDNIKRNEPGRVLILKLKAKNWEHNRLVNFVARSNRVSPKRVYFAGTKDKRSVKVQYFSIPGVEYREFTLKDVEILDHFYLNSPLTLGSHSSNLFKIAVSDCNEEKLGLNCDTLGKVGFAPNYYGPQRFGSLRPVTHRVGREIVKGNFKEAVRVFVGYPGEDRFAAVRKEFYDNPDPKAGIANLPPVLDLEINVLKHLIEHNEDYTGAIKRLPANLVSMFVHAYQGYIFNKILNRRLEVNKSLAQGDIFRMDGEIIRINSLNIERMSTYFLEGRGSPTGLVVGYNVDPARGIMGEIENTVLDQESIERSEFRLPFDLSSRGERRDLFLRFSNLHHTGTEVEFELPPGGYATSVLREIMRTDEMSNY